MTIYRYPREADWPAILARPESDAKAQQELEAACRAVFDAVERRGDEALRELTQKFDGVELQSIEIARQEISRAQIDPELQAAIELAAQNIEAFHRAQLPQAGLIAPTENPASTGRPERQNQPAPRLATTTKNGVECWQEARAVERVGLYVPGGSAPLFSTVLMLAIPARLAGCREVVLCTPPRPHPAILWTARLCGVHRIFQIGGAQAIAAMTLGTASVPRVDKIFGPGNRYVVAAKGLATTRGVAIDMPAGPSEVLVVADSTAHPAFVAADLLSQAEHGADSQVIMVTWDASLPEKVAAEVARQLEQLPRREVAEKALANSCAIVVRDAAEAMALSNAYAPEHLILAVDNPAEKAAMVVNAGSVFMGHHSPESVGDYASGTNHTLPTAGWARSFSGVNIDAFVKKITFQSLSEAGLSSLAPAVAAMARAEGLDAHARAVAVRLGEQQLLIPNS